MSAYQYSTDEMTGTRTSEPSAANMELNLATFPLSAVVTGNKRVQLKEIKTDADSSNNSWDVFWQNKSL